MATDLDDLLNPRTFVAGVCPIRQMIDALDPADREKAETAVLDGRVPRDSILQWFEANTGIRGRPDAISRHRKGVCACRTTTTS